VVAAHGHGPPVSAFWRSAAASSASTGAVPGLASDVSRAARFTTGPYTSPNLVSTRPAAVPTRNAGKRFRSRSGLASRSAISAASTGWSVTNNTSSPTI
jgi:hypothetical protein